MGFSRVHIGEYTRESSNSLRQEVSHQAQHITQMGASKLQGIHLGFLAILASPEFSMHVRSKNPKSSLHNMSWFFLTPPKKNLKYNPFSLRNKNTWEKTPCLYDYFIATCLFWGCNHVLRPTSPCWPSTAGRARWRDLHSGGTAAAAPLAVNGAAVERVEFVKLGNEQRVPARWARASYKWSLNPYKWPKIHEQLGL